MKLNFLPQVADTIVDVLNYQRKLTFQQSKKPVVNQKKPSDSYKLYL